MLANGVQSAPVGLKAFSAQNSLMIRLTFDQINPPTEGAPTTVLGVVNKIAAKIGTFIWWHFWPSFK
jgi:hypothetical protein